MEPGTVYSVRPATLGVGSGTKYGVIHIVRTHKNCQKLDPLPFLYVIVRIWPDLISCVRTFYTFPHVLRFCGPKIFILCT